MPTVTKSDDKEANKKQISFSLPQMTALGPTRLGQSDGSRDANMVRVRVNSNYEKRELGLQNTGGYSTIFYRFKGGEYNENATKYAN
jgi:hypothetical protein